LIGVLEHQCASSRNAIAQLASQLSEKRWPAKDRTRARPHQLERGLPDVAARTLCRCDKRRKEYRRVTILCAQA
jgi:hypothetical protein